MAEILDISGCEQAPLAEAWGSAEPVVRALLLAGGQSVKPRPMLWPCDLAEADAPHREERFAPDAEVFFVRDVVIGGYGGHTEKDGRFIFADGVYPGYVKHYVSGDINPEHWRIDGMKTIAVPSAIVVTHFNLIYGHWLLEILPRLFAVRRLATLGVKAPLVMPSTAPPYMLKVAAEILPGHELVLYDPASQRVAADVLILPSMLHSFYIFHPALGRDLDQLSSTLASARSWPEGIFISRVGLPNPSYRQMTNAQAIERQAQRLGLSVIHPERMSWFDQVSLFSQSRLIVGEFGSGLHTAIFSPPGTKVVALNWIVDVQSRIGNFRGHDVGYILPSDGVPRGFTLETPTVASDYEIDIDTFAARVEPLLSSRRQAPLRKRFSLW